jgi:hypothetical protein
MAARRVTLSINDSPIALNNFVREYIDHVVDRILTSLSSTGEIKSLDLIIEGAHLSVVLNNADLPINPFVTRIIRNTMKGMVSSLKGVSTIEKMQVIIKK